jgi:hypothetical protein
VRSRSCHRSHNVTVGELAAFSKFRKALSSNSRYSPAAPDEQPMQRISTSIRIAVVGREASLRRGRATRDVPLAQADCIQSEAMAYAAHVVHMGLPCLTESWPSCTDVLGRRDRSLQVG